MAQPTCPCCQTPTGWSPPPPWDCEPMAEMCSACENRAEEEADKEMLQQLIEAAARSGRFDLI